MMIQRYERRTIEQELITVRAELASDYQSLQQINYQQLTPSDSAELLLAMLNKLSSPTIGTQILRTDLFHLEYPYLAQYEMIMDKAEIYYYQSIIQDLTRIRNNEMVVTISKEEIRQCIQELNWKVNVQRSSMLNQSQQVGENMDLMKFFEGVRNYQNWNENIKRQTFTRLKERAHSIQNELSFKKGFILSKIQHQIQSLRKNHLSEIFDTNRRYVRFQKVVQMIDKFRQRRIKGYFELLLARSKETSAFEHFNRIFTRYIPRKLVAETRKVAMQVKLSKDQIAKLVTKLINIKKRSETLLKFAAFSRFNIKPMIKASKYTSAVKLVSHACQKYYVRIIIKTLNMPAKSIFRILSQVYENNTEYCFRELKNNDIQIRLQRPNVSYKLKGMVLASLNKYQQQPISAKKTFSKWYLNTHQEKYAKKVYNIWLQGQTNKFTFFMRLKNLVQHMSKQETSKEMKNFVKVICDKFHKYEEHSKKYMLTRWIRNNRRLRKIEDMFKLLTSVTNQTQQHFKKSGVDKVAAYCKRKQIIKQYCNKYMLQYIQNVKIALQKWQKINNIKKQWGRKKLRLILLQNTQSNINSNKQIIGIFKQNWKEGQQIKKKHTSKAINKDYIFLQRFMQIWQRNVKNSIVQAKIANKQNVSTKEKSLLQIQSVTKRFQTYVLRDSIKKFASNRLVRQRRENNLKNNFIKIIESNQLYLKKYVSQIFIQNKKEGAFKKQKLVTQLVHANIIKQKLGLLIMRNKSFEITQLLKRQKSSKVFQLLQNKVKQNYLIFNKRLFTACILQKIVNNYTSNIQLAFKNWKAIPLRMRWKLRNKVITLQQKLNTMYNERLACFKNELKDSLITAKLKQRKGVYIMACQFQMVMKRYFNKYQTNVAIIKQDDKIIKVSQLFESMQQRSNSNFKVIMSSPPIWPKKAHHFTKLNETIKKRLLDYFLSWHKNANALKYFGEIKDEKKKRNLQILSKVFNSVEARKVKTIIEKFQMNYRKRIIKNHILKKMCDSQVMRILKAFEAWKKLPIPTNKKTIEKAAKFQSSLTNLVKRNLKITVNAMKKCYIDGGEKKLHLVRKLVSGVSSRIHTLFNIWREKKNIKKTIEKQNKVEAFFQTLVSQSTPLFQLLMFGNEASRKRKSLTIIQNYWTNQYKSYIKRWCKNTINLKMRDLSKRHLLINLANIKQKHQNKILVEKIVKFAKNRATISNQKKRVKQMHISKMIQNYQSHKRLLLNVTVDKLKFLHIKGNFHKNRAFSKFLREKITQINKMLEIWNNLANQAKQKDKNRIVASNFDCFEEALKRNFHFIFGRTKQTSLKKNIIDKIFQSVESKHKDCFSIWRQKVKQYKILGQLDKQSKATILERINKIVQSTSTQAVLTAIKKFHLNFKVQRLQRRFIEKLLQTKSGSVIIAFNQWKTIPVASTVGKYKDYQKFYFKMQNFFKNRLKFAHKAFSETSQDATLMKKQSILKLFEMTSLGIRRYYNRWTRLTKQKHILMTVNWVLKAFQTGQSSIIKQNRIVFKDSKVYRAKVDTISKLVQAITNKTHNYLSLWKQNARFITERKRKIDQAKRKALITINRTMATSQQGNILKVVSLFQLNSKVVKVAKSFFNRLMNTKTGKVLGFFQKLKTIPDAKLNKLKKKAIVFESKMNSFSLKRLRDTLAPFKQSTYSANTKMKYCLDRLARACMGDNKKKFLSWRNINRQSKVLSHTSLFQKLFNQMQNSYRNNYDLVIKDAASEVQKKKNLCRKLLNNSLFVQHHAYMIWKQAYHVDDINTKKRQNHYTNHLKNLITVFNSNQNKKVIQVIGIFRKLLELRNFQQYDFYKNYKNKKGVNFYSNLNRIQSNNQAVFINALKANRAEFLLAEKSQKLLTLFQTMQNASKANMSYLVRTQQQTNLLNKTFTKLSNNTMNNICRLFSIWRSNKKVKNIEITVKNEKKRQALKALNSLLIDKKNNQIAQLIHKFNINLKASLIIKNVLIKIIKTRTDKHSSSFNLWKNLPYQQARKLKNKATKFERGLLNILRGNLKEANDCFKKNLLDGINKKEEAARRIVRSKLLDTNRLFFRWRKINNQNKITEKIITLDKAFANIETVVHNNLTIFEQCKMQDQRKVRSTTNLFNNNVKKLNGFFNIWRGKAKTLKLHHFEKLIRNFNPEDFNKRLMRIGFMMIEKRKQMQVLKGYINSLWKWKLSNIQASYYTKFLNVFRESEELIKLSNVINKKLYENVHHAFRNILSVGHSRTNRKREIVQKYLTRKARNYFLIFKNNTLKSQINIWKSKYTESIKAKIVSDVLTSIFLKTKYAALSTLNQYHNFTNKINHFEKAFQNCQNNAVKQAFNKIKLYGHSKLLGISDRLAIALNSYNLRISFAALNYNRRALKLDEVINKIITKHSYCEGFGRINRRKERIIKSRLSIILLQTLIKNQVTEEIKASINKFKKNRSKRIGAERIFKFANLKYESYAKRLLQECTNIQNITRLLQRFKRGQKLQKILEKQDEMLKKSYLNKMRKKENKWMELAIKKFATRASIRSSPAAITLWRLKTFALNT